MSKRAFHGRAWNGHGAGSGYDGEAVAEVSGGKVVRLLAAQRTPTGAWSLCECAVDEDDDRDPQEIVDEIALGAAGNYADWAWAERDGAEHREMAGAFDDLEAAA